MRTYSSGMSARLRFAIAASVTHRVLLIDEALAVGDAKFSRRSEQRIRELRDQAGTVFLVSHSLKSVLDTCERALWIDKGILRLDGPSAEVVKAYQASVR
jgi:teichoic acid transport system ATP-binding protein